MKDKLTEADRIIADLFGEEVREAYGKDFDRLKKMADTRSKDPIRPDTESVRARARRLYRKLALNQGLSGMDEGRLAVTVKKLVMENSSKTEIRNLAELMRNKQKAGAGASLDEKERAVVERAYHSLPQQGMTLAAFSRGVLALMGK